MYYYYRLKVPATARHVLSKVLCIESFVSAKMQKVVPWK